MADAPPVIEDAEITKQAAAATSGQTSDDEWLPYDGPRGGQGWQNVNDPDDIRYQDEPPGDVYGDLDAEDAKRHAYGAYNYLVRGDRVAVTSEDHGVRFGTYQDTDGNYEARVTWEIIEDDDGNEFTVRPEDTVIVVDGQMPEEGERVHPFDLSYGDTVRALSSWGETTDYIITDLDDDGYPVGIEPGRSSKNTSTFREGGRFTRIDDANEVVDTSVLFHDLEFRDFRFRDRTRVQEYIHDSLIQRADDEIWRTVLPHINTIEDQSGGKNRWSGRNRTLTFERNARESVLAHEFAHAMADAYGYDYDPAVNLFAKFFVSDLPRIPFGEPRKKAFAEAFAAKHLARGEDDEVIDEQRDQAMELAELFMEDRGGDEPITKEDFLLTRSEFDDEPVPEGIERLIEEVNATWLRIAEHVENGEMDRAKEITPFRPYLFTNGHEMLAGLQQAAQAEHGDEANLIDFHVHHPDLLNAYLGVFEPSEPAREVLRDLDGDYL